MGFLDGLARRVEKKFNKLIDGDEAGDQAPPEIPQHSRPQVCSDAGPVGQLMHGAYYPNWGVYTVEPEVCMPPEMTTHIFYAFASVDPNGNVGLTDEYADLQKPINGVEGGIAAVRAIREKNPSIKLILSLGGGAASQNFAGVAADPNKRRQLAENSRQTIDNYGFQGIDVDWEHPSTDEQGDNYVLLLQEMRNYLPADEGYVLTSAVPAGEWALRTMRMGQAARYLDFVNLMAYDFSGPWGECPKANHHAQLFGPSDEPSGDRAVRYLQNEGVPTAKIILGIPIYGRTFVGASEIGSTFESCNAGEDGTYQYRKMPVDWNTGCDDTSGVEVSCDPLRGAVAKKGNELITYDNHVQVARKAQYVRDEGLGGVFYWSAHMDHTDKETSLFQNGFQSLIGSP